MNPTLNVAANGHMMLDLNDSPDSYWQSLSEHLVTGCGFHRVGEAVIGAGEQIHQSFYQQTFTLAAGWDNWSGHYLLSESVEGDEFLKKLFDEIGK